MTMMVSDQRSGKTLLVVLLAVLVVGAAAAIWLWSGSRTQPSPDDGRKIAESFLQNVRDGRAGNAWDATTAEFKSALGRESFVKEAKGMPWLTKPVEFVSTNTVTVQDQQRSEYLFRSPEGKEVRLVLGNEAGAWKVDRWMAAK